ncbi:uncharacterized protein YALI1_B22512g [Yarrowia lipolytica]|uniref:DASH complex subunit DAD3 n=1 Tax=Yarrowia lipolytica TaxID=4952 RepID=A0A1D8N874_YARLL|nr:hypothetical protein YALI1_B22512g [Yarrowia lipolytica]
MRLDLNLRSLTDEIRVLTEGPSQVLSEQLSELQSKVYVIRTLIKSSVYNYAKMKGQEMEHHVSHNDDSSSDPWSINCVPLVAGMGTFTLYTFHRLWRLV